MQRIGESGQSGHAGQSGHVIALAKLRMAKKKHLLFGQQLQLTTKQVDAKSGQYGFS